MCFIVFIYVSLFNDLLLTQDVLEGPGDDAIDFETRVIQKALIHEVQRVRFNCLTYL